MVDQAIILVGGKGTRLGSITAETPKPLLPIEGDKRFLDYLLQRVADHGFTDIILIAGHLGHTVEDRYAGARFGASRVSVITEPSPAGTGGALHYARDRLAETFLMMNGDSLFDFDVRALVPALGSDDLGALALRTVPDGRRYGTVETVDGHVTRFTEKDASREGESTISGGVYLLRRSVLDWIKALPCSIEAEVFPKFAEVGKLACARFDGYFIDIGLPDTLDQARAELPVLLEATRQA